MATDETTLDLGIGPEMEEGLEMLGKLEGITDITAMDGPLLTFTGRLVTTLDGVSGIERVDVFDCARGWYLFFVPQQPENWATAGADLEGRSRGYSRRRLRRRGPRGASAGRATRPATQGPTDAEPRQRCKKAWPVHPSGRGYHRGGRTPTDPGFPRKRE